MRRGYVVPMMWMVIYEYGVPGGAVNLNSNYPDHGHHGDPPLSGKNPHGRARNRTRDFMNSSQIRWPLDHEAGRIVRMVAARNVMWTTRTARNANGNRELILKFQAKQSWRRPRFVGGIHWNLYAAETWCLKAKTIAKLNSTEMNFWQCSTRISRKDEIRNNIIK
jgi:hypothetical protein